jgi:hypothetical protein
MTQTVTFHNKATIKIQAQIFTGRALIGTCLAAPGETLALTADEAPYDIFFRNGATGLEVARKLNSEAKVFTLNQRQGHYSLT